MRIYIFSILLLFLYLSCAPKIKKEPAIERGEPTISDQYLWVYKPTVNVRDQNSTKSKKIGSLADGDSALVLRNVNGWYEIIFDHQKSGWIRSDLLGTKNLSPFRKSVSFIDSLKENFAIQLYFDKSLQHKRIYLEFPIQYYSSEKNIRKKTNEIIAAYQKNIYHGEISVHILTPNNQENYLTMAFNGKPNPEIKLPILPFGILQNVEIEGYTQLKVEILVKEKIENSQFIKAAREIAKGFPLSFTLVQINFISDKSECIFSFLEDSAGETYKFNQCL